MKEPKPPGTWEVHPRNGNNAIDKISSDGLNPSGDTIILPRLSRKDAEMICNHLNQAYHDGYTKGTADATPSQETLT